MTRSGLRDFFFRQLLHTYDARESSSLFFLVSEEVLGLDRARMLAEPDREVGRAAEERFREIVGRLLQHEPVQYILGFAWFCGLRIGVSPDVLIPRPETEQLVKLALEYCHSREDPGDPVVLDLGTGSGCIALAMAAGLKTGRVTGTDISEPALRMARANAAALGLDTRFHRWDLFDCDIPFQPGSVDVLVSNPPYVMQREKRRMKPNVLSYEPAGALFVSDADPLAYYRQIAFLGKKLLAAGGKICLEINENLGRQTRRLFEDEGYAGLTVHQDLFGRDRFLEGMPAGRP